MIRGRIRRDVLCGLVKSVRISGRTVVLELNDDATPQQLERVCDIFARQGAPVRTR